MKNTSRMSSSVSAISLSTSLLMEASTSNSSLFKYAKLNMVEDTDTDFGDNDGDSRMNIYKVNEDESHIQEARKAMLINPFVGPLDSANYSYRKLSDDDKLQLLSISPPPPPPPSNLEYPITHGRLIQLEVDGKQALAVL